MKKFQTVMLVMFFGILATIIGISITGNSLLVNQVDQTALVKKVKPFPVTDEKIPEGLVWENGGDQKELGSTKAVKGGTYNTFVMSYPTTFRRVGPDSNSSFRGELDNNNFGLVSTHPETADNIPAIAKEWAIGKDERTVYYRLDPDATWSDGQPVTADDFVFMWRFMCTPGIIAPWYNEFYSTHFEEILKFDDHTIAVRLANPMTDLVYNTSIEPLPYHFFGEFRNLEKELPVSKAISAYKRMKKKIPEEFINAEKDFNKAKETAPKEKPPEEPKVKAAIEDVEENWIKKYNWVVIPNTGPYNIVSYTKSKDVLMKRNPKWWAKDKKFYKHRYNVDYIRYKLIRDYNQAYERFKKNEIDTFLLVLPEYWHNKTKYLDVVEKGYVNKIWFYNDAPQPCMLMTFNTTSPPLDDINVRKGLAYSFNFEKMINTVLRGDYERSNTFHEGYGEFTNTKIKAREFDLVKASEYFEKAGWGQKGTDGVRVKDGKRLELTILYTSPLHTPRLLVLKEEALKAGIDIKLENYDGNAVFVAMLDKKHQIAWHGWAEQLRPSYWGQYHKDNAHKKKNNNFSNLDDDEVSELINQYRKARDKKSRVEFAHQIEQRLYDLVPAIPTYKVPYVREAYWRWIQLPEGYGTKLTSNSLTDYGLFWIDEKLKEEILSAMKKNKTIYGTEKVIVEKRYLGGKK